MKKSMILLAVILSLILIGCDKKVMEDEESDLNELVGTVTAVTDDSIEVTDSDGGLYRIYLTEELTYSDGVSDEFEVGNKVVIGYTGGVMESWPMQINSVKVISNEK